MAIRNPFYNPNTYGYESMDYFRRKEEEYYRYMREQEEKMRYMRAQQGMMNAAPVAPQEAPKPKAPDPLGFMNKAENKLLLTTGELK